MNLFKQIKVSFTKLILTLAACLSITIVAYADPTSNGPKAFSNELLAYIEKNANKVKDKQNDAKSRLESLGKGTKPNIKRHAYSGGVPYSIFFINSLIDLFRDIIPKFASCANPKPAGVCLKPKPLGGFKVKPKWNYHFPTEVIEVVREKGLSAYVPDSYEFLLSFSEEVEYAFAADNTQTTSYLTYLASMVELRKRFPDIKMGKLFEETDFAVSNEILQKLEEIKKAVPEEQRLSLRTKGKAGTNAEYHVLPSLASVWLYKYYKYLGYLTGFPPEIFEPCHDFPKWGDPYMSEWPYPESETQGGMTPLHVSRVLALTSQINAQGPNRDYAQQMKDFLSSPLACLQDNNELKTKVDLLFPGLKIEDQNSGQGGCYKNYNLPNRLVSLKFSTPDKYHTSAAETAAVKGMHIAYDMFPENFYDFDLLKDKIQWTRPDSLPNKCSFVYEPLNEAQQYEKANEDTRGSLGLDADLKTLFKYRRFSCCPSGYFAFPPNEKKL